MPDTTKTESKQAISIDVGAKLYESLGNGNQRFVGEIISKTVSDNVVFMAVRREHNNEICTRAYYKRDESALIAV